MGTIQQSSYPRAGEPLVPTLLAPLFAKLVPSSLASRRIHFSDLNSGTWDMFTAAECQRLARDVISRLSDLGADSLIARLGDGGPTLPTVDAPLRTLGLDPRTLNALARHQVVTLSDLEGITIAELLSIRGFGVRSLLDLLCAVEHRQVLEAAQSALDPALADERLRLTREVITLLGGHTLGSQDCRFGKAASLLGGGAVQKPLGREVARLIQLRDEVARALTLTVEDEAQAMIDALGDERNGAILRARFGLEGRGPRTLESVAGDFGLTRERVRQVEAKSRAVFQRSWAPVQARLQTAVSDFPGGDERRLIEFLKQARLVDQEATVVRIREIGRLLSNRSLPLVSIPLGRRRSELWLGRDAASEQTCKALREVGRVAQALSNSTGATSLSQLAWRLEEKHGAAISGDLLEMAVTLLPSRFLGDGWLVVGELGPRNRLLNVARKLLSITPRVSLGELRAALQKNYRLQGAAPPEQVIAAVLDLVPSIAVVDGFASATETISQEDALSESEQLFVEVFTIAGPVISCLSLESLCLTRGMNLNSFWQWLTYSPILVRVGPGLYALRGAEIPLGTVEKVRRVGRGKKFVDFGWDDEGHPWYTCSLDTRAISSGKVLLPHAFSVHVQGAWDLTSHGTGKNVGVVRIDGEHLSGLRTFVDDPSGPKEFLSLTWITEQRACLATWGGSELLKA